MQHNLRDPSRDRDPRPHLPHHLRGPAAAQARRRSPASRSTKLLDLLKEPEDRVRYRAKIELGAATPTRSSPRVKKWVAGLDKNDPDYEHHMLEALWVHQYHNVVERRPARSGCSSSPDFRARAAATRVLCYWRDRVPDALDLLKKLAADAYPRVRLEAVRAASFFTVPEAIEVAPDLGRAPDRRLPRLHPRRDDAGARART